MILRGEISAEEDLSIEGQVEGIVRCGGTVLVLPSGKVSANISADSVVISGYVRGNIAAANQIEIRSSGDLVGDIKCSRVSIEDGARFRGNIEIQKRWDAHRDLAVEGSLEAEEFDRIAESDIVQGHYTTFKDDANLEEQFLRMRSKSSKFSHGRAVMESH